MNQQNEEYKNKFLYSRHRYRGQFRPEYLVFNNNLQEFAQKVSIIANFQTSGKLSSEEAYKQIQSLWQRLKQSKQELGIGKSTQM